MKKISILGTILLSLAALLLLAGCGGDQDTGSQAESAAPAEEAAPAAEATTAVATHDCAGGCGMKDWPEDKMTEIDGKWYCAGCAKKVQAESEKEGHGDG